MALPGHHNLNSSKKTRTSQRIANRKRHFNEMMSIQGSADNAILRSDPESAYSVLESINDDCLRQIVQYLNIMDVISLAATCPRLLHFAEDCIYTNKAEQICVRLYRSQATLTAPFDRTYSSQYKLESYENAFRCFGTIGKFVKVLTFKLKDYSCNKRDQNKISRNCAIMMENCLNLTTLRIHGFKFRQTDVRVLQSLIERFQFLKELDITDCSGLTQHWRAALKKVSTVDTLSLTAVDKFGHFFEYFRNLSTLTIHFSNGSAEDIAKVFDYNGHSLKQLKLQRLHVIDGYESVGWLIIDKLPKLESLGLWFKLNNHSKYLIELPHLKSLEMFVDKNINSVLQTLCDGGIIEELTIHGGTFEDEVANASPLVFKKLQGFKLKCLNSTMGLLKTMTQSHTPEIRTFVMAFCPHNEVLENDLLEFIKSKKTLKHIQILLYDDDLFVRIEFIRQIIAILKKPCTPKRPVLYIQIGIRRFVAEEMELFNENKHLIRAKSISA